MSAQTARVNVILTIHFAHEGLQKYSTFSGLFTFKSLFYGTYLYQDMQSQLAYVEFILREY